MPKNIALLTAFLLIAILISAAGTLQAGDMHIYINGQDYFDKFDTELIDGCLMVKARSLADILGAEINWFKAIKTIHLKKDDTKLKMMADNPYIQVNDKTYKTEHQPTMLKGSSYLPLKEVIEHLGYLYQENGKDIYINKPSSYVKGISWQKSGQQLLLELDKISPYRINKTDDPKKIVLELDQTALSPDFKDDLSNKNFYLKIEKVANRARLRLSIISKYPIPFQRDMGIDEDGNNLLINFLPSITAIDWKNNRLKITANGDIRRPEILLLQNPKRMVLDIPGLMLNNFDLNIEKNDWIEDVRVSQFKYDPVTLRVVLDLVEDKQMELVQDNSSNTLILKPADLSEVRELKFENSILSFITDQSTNPDLFFLEEPDRLVINLINTVRGDNFPDKIDVKGELITAVRTAKFNEETVRIVADMTRESAYKLEQKQLSNGKFKHIIKFENGFNKLVLTDSTTKTDISFDFLRQANYEVKRLSYPDRLVVDIQGIGGISQEELPEPLGLIEGIRIGQLSSEPQVSRVTFDLTDYHGHKVISMSPDSSINITLIKGAAEPVTGKNVIVIDAGHGGFDPGAIGPSGLKEKDVTLSIALKVQGLLESEGYDIVLTREQDNFISLKERVDIANEIKARLFVSIHANASNSRYADGTETYIAPDKPAENKLLARVLQRELSNSLKRKNRGILKDNFYVIKYTEMPSALVEVAFISNPHEESLLSSDFFLEKAARAISKGIKSYLDNVRQGDEGVDE
ncbi:N-acetylmuramoyl-L-alanine amidase family protein [Halocella sp. SP3-1]|uniref:N-acetylmuramoyl-L-alanine amidase family protein n=1 Tax=Halocella sp. SP3-1 TaxID=2382161 RepID=UPI000F760FB2|nr:N-acetylmuramoyl-L-alanine amidase family protein [Halocella sp. SP3-1]AZO94183.1 AMIN domain-containing protein [Halocella sp. SP3-1]